MASCSQYSLSELEKDSYGYMLELICWLEWQEFKQTHQVSSRDSIQGILCRNIEKTPYQACRLQLLLIMCKLVDGEDYYIRYSEDSIITVLEGVALSFDAILQYMHDYPHILKASEEYRLQILKQAVFVCCKAGDFDAANEVYQRQWLNVPESALDIHKEVLDVIKSEDKNHKLLIDTNNSYDKFLCKLVLFLDKIFQCLPEPFFLQVLISKHEKRHLLEIGETTVINNPFNKISDHFGHIHKMWMTIPTTLTAKLNNIRKETLKDVAVEMDTSGRKVRDKRNLSWNKEINNNEHQNDVSYNDKVNKSRSEKQSRKRTASDVLSMAHKDRKKLKEATDQYGKHFPLSRRYNSDEDDDEDNDESSEKETTAPPIKKNLHRFQYNKNRNRHDCLDDNSQSLISDSDIEELNRPPHLKRIQHQHRVCEGLRYTKQVPQTSLRSLRNLWTEEEEEEFYLKVQEYGIGNWSAICNAMKTRRTNVNLKDKWRQLKKSERMKYLIKKYGHISKIITK